MCRLLALASSEPVDALAWLGALRRAAEYDPLLERLAGTAEHGDGWGLAALAGGRLIHYRSPTPIWSDPLVETLATSISSPVALVAHARKASTGMPLGVGAAHPFALHLGNGGVVFVAQNGGVDIGRTLELFGPVASPSNVDSFVYAAALARLLEESGSLKRALIELHRGLERGGAVRGMANTVALLVERRGELWEAEIGVVRHVVREQLLEYGEIYLLERDGLAAAVSSTLRWILEEEMEPVGRNTVLTAALGDPRFERSAL
ncbi:MAG: class II glutamine amidotransferase [Thermofilaceae archaeon]